jgi:hypothetical protein
MRVNCDGFWRIERMSEAQDPDVRWELTTHEGNRREQLRRARKLTLRERLQALEEMTELSGRLRFVREGGEEATR